MASFKYENSWMVQDLFFTWIFSPLLYYNKNPPNLANTFELPKQVEIEEPLKKLKSCWADELKKKEPNFFSAMLKTIYKDLIRASIMTSLGIQLNIFQAVLINFIISNLQSSDSSQGSGILAALFIFSTILSCALKHNGSLRVMILNGKIKNLVALVVTEKVVRLNNCAVQEENTKGKILNVMSSDLEILELSVYCIYFLCVPFTVITNLLIIIFFFGVTGLIGIGVSILHAPIVILLGKIMIKIRLRANKIGDKRIKMIQNLIEGIKIMKLYAWEIPLLQKIKNVRVSEIKRLKKVMFINGFLNIIAYAGNNLLIFVTLVVHVRLGHSLDPGKVFMLISLYYTTHFHIAYISTTGASILFAFIGIMKRIGQILLLPETEIVYESPIEGLSISLAKGAFTWKNTKQKNYLEDLNNSTTGLVRSKTVLRDCLRDLSFNLTTKELLMVVGPVGCGKSSLFLGLLGEIYITEGSLARSSAVAYASEEPWLVTGSIKDNILMGRPLNQERYNSVLSACDLYKDLEIFKNSDETLVADKGLTLSGGQRARINLARALYTEADLYFLDDPLSAVDAKVANHLFENCIKGFLKDKAIVLATHQIQFLPQSDKILVLDHGEQIFIGTYNEMKENGEVKEVLGDFIFGESDNIKKQRKMSMKENEIGEKLIEDVEEVNEQSISFKVYWKYTIQGFKSIWIIIAVLAVMGAHQAVHMYTLYWPSYWSKQSDQDSPYYINGYAVLLVLSYLGCCLRVFPCMIGFINGNVGIHNNALTGLVLAPSLFFDKNQTGWLLNRFSKDVGVIDGPLQHYIFESVSNNLSVIGYIITIIVIIPYNIIILPFMAFGWFLLLKFVAPIIVKLRKLELIGRGPILATTTSALDGLACLRCLSLQSLFINRAYSQSNIHQKSYLTFHVFMRFVQLYAEFISNLLLIMNAILIISIKSFISTELAAFSLSTSLSLLGLTSLWFKSIVELSTNMSSAQRLQDFSELLPEGTLNEEEVEFSITEGSIEFNKISMRYRSNLDLVLNNLSFRLPGKSKIGIVGRTGSGKSSILQVLFRLVNPESGQVIIDGQDYMNAGLHQLRKQMSVIPQSAILFLGTVRDNLDPFQLHSDPKLFDVLDKVKLKNYILDQDHGLKTELSSVGVNFSAGQKQLLCLARAILRGNKIVMMDEATANVDNETDRFIQQSVRTLFNDCTVLIIAHRLRTIINSDKIIVLDKGTCAEFDSPTNLAKKPESLFAQMIENTGLEESQYLKAQLT